MTNLQTKVCCVCELKKELSDFYKDKYSSDGLTYKCKECFKHIRRYNKHLNYNTECLQGEVWKDIAGYEGYYLVSNFGRVKSLDRVISHKTCGSIIRRSVLLTPHKDNNGYRNCILSRDGKNCFRKVHILVWEAFGEQKRNGRIIVVDHKDNDKSNNSFDNLQLLPHRVNTTKDKQYKNLLGANYIPRSGRWNAKIKINKKSILIGSFDTELAAHEAYTQAVKDVESGLGLRNRNVLERPKKSKYIGVSLLPSNRWRAMINVNNKRYPLGVFATEEEAAQAYQTALNQLQNKAA